MSLPSGVKYVYEGNSRVFLLRMRNFTNCLEDLFTQVRRVGLEAATRNLKRIRICEALEAGMNLATYDPPSDTVNIYPMAWQSGSRFDVAFHAGLGLRHWVRNISQENRLLWLEKAIRIDPRSYSQVSGWFSGQLDYNSILGKFTTEDSRVTAWVLIQLLRDGGVSHLDLRTNDLAHIGCTASFISGKKPYSLKPLIMRFGGGMLNVSSYEGAFASFVCHGGKIGMADQDVSAALTLLFKSVSATSLSSYGTIR